MDPSSQIGAFLLQDSQNFRKKSEGVSNQIWMVL